MAGRDLNQLEHTTDFSLGGVVGNAVNVQTVGGVVGDMEEGDAGALRRVHRRGRVVRRRRRVAGRHVVVGGSGTAHHPVIHQTKNYRAIPNYHNLSYIAPINLSSF